MARAPRTNIQGTMGVSINGLRTLSRDLKASIGHIPVDLTNAMKHAGQIVADTAKGYASWSTRIPESIKVMGGGNKQGTSVTAVSVKAGGAKAPHAAAYEGTKGDVFRHPVWGNMSNWVSQDTRPYLARAANEKADIIAEQVAIAVDAAWRRAGFH